MIDELRRYERTLLRFQSLKNSIDYNFKSNILNLGLDKIINKIEYSNFMVVYNSNYYNDFDFNAHDKLLDILFQKYGTFSYLEAYRINNARFHRISRLKKRVGYIISKRSFFLTLTFTNSTLSKTSSKTRREYVTRYLKSITNNYVANIDFGSKNGREHYHAVVQCENICHSDWIYGAINFELITIDDLDSNFNELTNERISKYISKLTNHAIKETTKRCSLIYPRKSKTSYNI